MGYGSRVRTSKHHAKLPIGQTARIAFEIDAIRAGCCAAATVLMNERPLKEAELEECARLDDALAKAQRLLKSAVRSLMFSRLHRRSRSL